jgi:hypothetical protein
VWHASVAMLGESGPVGPDQLPRSLRRIGASLARELIAGVGMGPVYEHLKQVAQHARRALTDGEIAGLDPTWLAIEPVDMA